MTKPWIYVCAVLSLCSLAISDAVAQSTTSFPVSATCSGGGQLCNNLASIPVTTTGLLRSQFTGGGSLCSNVRIHYLVDGTEVAISDFVGANESTATIDLGPVSAGAHVIGLQAEGQLGGCNLGTLGAWAGTALVTVGLPQPLQEAAPVPTLSEFATALLVLMVGIGGIVAMRRKSMRL